PFDEGALVHLSTERDCGAMQLARPGHRVEVVASTCREAGAEFVCNTEIRAPLRQDLHTPSTEKCAHEKSLARLQIDTATKSMIVSREAPVKIVGESNAHSGRRD